MLSVAHRRRESISRSASGPEQIDIKRNRVGPYRLCLELATGGMSVVYLACAEGVHGVRALKIITREHAARPGAGEMFLDEAEVVSRIRHPNVCSVLDYDTVEGDYYIAMEYLIGEPASVIRKKIERLGNLEPEGLARRVGRMMADVCEGLHAAHELTDVDGEPMNVVHRDVSPENLFLTYDGLAKVVDFGLVCLDNQHHRTRTGMLKGKVAYIAPELLEGERPDRRADVWGAGVVTWELLTGKRLFRRDTDLDTLRAVAAAPIARPSELRPGLPPAIDEVVMRALERDPALRFQTAQQLGHALLRIASSGAEVVSTSDLASWMAELFPGGAQRRRGLVDLALQVHAAAEDRAPLEMQKSSESVPPRPPGPADTGDAVGCACRTPPPPPPDQESANDASARSTTPPQLTIPPPPPLPRTARSGWVAATLALGVLMGSAGTAGIWLLAGPVEPAATPSPTGQSPAEPSTEPRAPAAGTAPREALATSSPPASSAQECSGSAAPYVVPGPVAIEVNGTRDDLIFRIRTLTQQPR